MGASRQEGDFHWKKLVCQVDNIRWDVDSLISGCTGYEAACEKCRLPHCLPSIESKLMARRPTMREIKNAVIEKLSLTYGFEAIDVDLTGIRFEKE